MTDFLKVDGAEIDLKTALQWRLALSDDQFIRETAADAAVVHYCKSENISVSKEEIQNVFDELRHMQNMESADETKGWMKESGISEKSMSQICEITALRNKIRKSISDDDCREEFNADQPSYDVAEIYSITVDDEDLANEIISQIEEGEDSFYNLAIEHSVDDETYKKAGYVGEVKREQVRAEAETLIFTAENDSVVGPVLEDDQYTVYLVKKVVKPDFDDVKENIRDSISESFLSDLPDMVKIEVAPLGTKKDPMEEVGDYDDDDDDDDD